MTSIASRKLALRTGPQVLFGVTGNVLPVGYRLMLQSNLGGNVLRGLRQVVSAPRRRQDTREDDTLSALLVQSLFGQEVRALPSRP